MLKTHSTRSISITAAVLTATAIRRRAAMLAFGLYLQHAKGIEPCIPSSRSRKIPYAYDKALYRQRHKVENLFAKLKDWRRIATRYDRCAHTFFSAICIAATVIFWL